MSDEQPQQKARVQCPTCGKEAVFFEPPIGPFCTQRCKLADLGRWLAEDYAVSEPLRPDHFDEYADTDPEGN